MARFVALLRGINVGKAKRVAMADLRALLESLGYGDVRTLLTAGTRSSMVRLNLRADMLSASRRPSPASWVWTLWSS